MAGDDPKKAMKEFEATQKQAVKERAECKKQIAALEKVSAKLKNIDPEKLISDS